MSHYRVGFCPQCEVQIAVQDIGGKWNSFKPNYREADLAFENGHKIRTIICASCLESPNYQTLMDAITHESSQAGSHDRLQRIKEMGLPTGITRKK